MKERSEISIRKRERIIRPKKGLIGIDFTELFAYRELFLFLAWRDILVRYKQTYVGIAWAVLVPFLTMVVFTLVFGKMGGFDSKGAPYAVLTLAALLPWNYFSNAVAESSNSLVATSNLVSKVYFPRLAIPFSSVLSGTVDFCVAMVILVVMMLYFNVAFTLHLLMLPVFFAMAFATALAVGLWLSSLNVKFRDVKYVVPFIVRIGLYISPVGFMTDLVPKKYLLLYSLNPMVGVIDGFRWSVLGDAFEPYWPGFFLGLGMTVLLVVSGLIYFRNTEKTFADVI